MANDPNTPITQGNLTAAIVQMMQGLPTLGNEDASNGAVLCINDTGQGASLQLVYQTSSSSTSNEASNK